MLYRPKCDGGLYDGDEKSRLETLLLAKDLGAEYIDLELQVIIIIVYFTHNLETHWAKGRLKCSMSQKRPCFIWPV